ncbi:MAG: pyridoxal-phosphate dependent enzyme [Cyclobacteriaceae bacterium]|jgi:L-serine/L-threonine ammonia-lyase|nr:pyridoxal-phosphate dependent enzyme [Flammeovirgaceae bacterium]
MLKPLYITTPIFKSNVASEQCNAEVFYKMECYQPTGSFKLRGMDFLMKDLASKGHKKVIGSSGGNAGYSLAYVGNHMSIGVHLVVPKTTSTYMIDKIKRFGANVEIFGENWDEANVYAINLSEELKLPYIPPFDHPQLWQGHSTIIDECALQISKPDKIVVAVGGGGLLSGIFEGLLRNKWSNVKIVTAETEGAASFAKSFNANQIVKLEGVSTIATSLAAKQVASQTLHYAKQFDVEPYIMSDKVAFMGCQDFFREFHTLVEPACGAALSYSKHNVLRQGEKVLVIVCGGVNMGFEKYVEYKEKYLSEIQ